MDIFWKASAVVILTIILGTTVKNDFSVVLSITACCIVMMVMLHYLKDVVAFLWKMGNSSHQNFPFISILLKITGVALLTELVGLLSADAGNSSLSKAIQLLGNAVILFLSLPLLEGFFSMIQEIMRII